MEFDIKSVGTSLKAELEHKINFKTKPPGSLGKLEEIAMQIAFIQQTIEPKLQHPCVLVFAGDHGIANEGVSAFPQEVTHQMVNNFLTGGAAINVFARQNGIEIKIIDAGVNHDFGKSSSLIDRKVGSGTISCLSGQAMTRTELEQCLDLGGKMVDEIFYGGSNIVGFGEMGIGNTSSASLIMSHICKLQIEDCVGRGTGVDDDQLMQKIAILKRCLGNHPTELNPLEVLQTFGGFEIAQICGAMLRAAEKRMVLLVDGFIATSAFLVAHEIQPAIKDYAISCHKSDESGHQKMLNYLGMDPILDLNMRLGEGTGCAVAYPIIASAISFMNEMASFDEAGVSNKE